MAGILKCIFAFFNTFFIFFPEAAIVFIENLKKKERNKNGFLSLFLLSSPPFFTLSDAGFFANLPCIVTSNTSDRVVTSKLLILLKTFYLQAYHDSAHCCISTESIKQYFSPLLRGVLKHRRIN